jgi:hypothetical protein
VKVNVNVNVLGDVHYGVRLLHLSLQVALDIEELKVQHEHASQALIKKVPEIKSI